MYANMPHLDIYPGLVRANVGAYISTYVDGKGL